MRETYGIDSQMRLSDRKHDWNLRTIALSKHDILERLLLLLLEGPWVEVSDVTKSPHHEHNRTSSGQIRRDIATQCLAQVCDPVLESELDGQNARADVVKLAQEALHRQVAIEDIRDLETRANVAGREVDEEFAPFDGDLR